ncbi:methionyl-tRNA formyltransferase [Solidesulfovibrio carbinoliphilus subsp. oakridgensis]|uniref:Methionyl-tRNA formyltransferase n=1 Tax=Solidesulfovibrio carbinoliphilus subsp. oakridgensis TaxID=694327 RepID=G7Q8E3_9BACT|nr:methionyl-tRNA formyltransferase [Solidesulfovibrio carbinoliphilus]EHJ48555.1 methionyl-tRNA formyltransferase [Solidesulfovibrio carbinoliphilus subsp. oakridgensis]
MGTPEFAATVLRHVLESDDVTVAAVYTQPDRPCGRGKKCRLGPVKELALEKGLPVHQPETFKDPAEVATLAAYKPDVLIVAAYGMILPQAVLDVPTAMPINVHASLLPAWRGAAPIERAVAAGDTMTGVTIMRMVAALDAGPMIMQRVLAIGVNDTAGMLRAELADLGGRVLVHCLKRLRTGGVPMVEQDPARVTYAKKIEKSEAFIDWSRPAAEVHNLIRAMTPHPGAFFFWQQAPDKPALRIIAHPGKVGCPLPPGACPGDILGIMDCHLAIACADAVYLIPTVVPAGKRPMDAKAFSCGYLGKCGDDATMAVCGLPEADDPA